MFTQQTPVQILALLAAVGSCANSSSQPSNEGEAIRQRRNLQNDLLREEPQFAYSANYTRIANCGWTCHPTGEAKHGQFLKTNIYNRDERLDAAATTFTEEERRRFSGIGRIECPSSTGLALATAFVAGSFSTMLTSAHAFRDPDTRARIDPRSCVVVFYNADTSIRESIRVREVYSRWDQPAMDGDPSNDVAIIRLEGKVRTASHYPPVSTDNDLRSPQQVSIVGFHLDLGPSRESQIRRMTGTGMKLEPVNYYTENGSIRNRWPLHNPETLAGGDYDCSSGASGSPIFNARGAVIGVHKGKSGRGGIFNPRDNFNMFILFDKRLAVEFEPFLATLPEKHDTPASSAGHRR